MKCRRVERWLLQAENPRLDSRTPAEIAEHVRACPDCRFLKRQLTKLEEAWRLVPGPAGSEEAKRAFLDRLARSASPVARSARLPRRRVLQWCAASAASLLALGTGTWLVVSEREARAADGLVDQLVDWNLDLTLAQSESERNRVYARQAERFRSALSTASLPEEQRSLAQELLENGSWLVTHQDPAAEADRFGSISEELLQLAQSAGARGNARRMNKLLRQYNRVLESGIDLNVQRAEASNPLDGKRRAKLDRLALRDADHLQQLASLWEAAPGAARKEIERAVGLHRDRVRKASQKKRKGMKAEG